MLGEISWTSQEDFREALAATLAKSQEDRRVFELVFERFFFRAVEIAAAREGVTEQSLAELGELTDAELDALREQIAAALRDQDEGAMRDLARMAIAAFARRQEGSGVIGVDVQRIRRALGLRAEPQPELPPEDPRHEGLPRDALRRFEALLRRELERAQIERTGKLPPARPLGELDRALPSGPLADLAAVHRVVAQLRRRLATQGLQMRGHRKHAHVDVRRTMRASLQTGGVPVELQLPPPAPETARDLRPLRRLHERHLGLGLLPVGAARAARHVPQDALVRVHRADLRGHRHLRTRAQLQGRQRGDLQRRRASPTSPATPTTGASGRSSSCRSRTTCTRARP